MAAAAARGLTLRAKFGRGGTHVGVARAGQLSRREALSPKDIRTISAYFARHEVDKQAKTKVWGDESDPSAGYIAWLLWGGDVGREWVDRIKEDMAG